MADHDYENIEKEEFKPPPPIPGRQPAPLPKATNSRHYVNSLTPKKPSMRKKEDGKGGEDTDDSDYEEAMDDSLPPIGMRQPRRAVLPQHATKTLPRAKLGGDRSRSGSSSQFGEEPVNQLWYQGAMNRQAAEAILKEQPKGTFLVRKSAGVGGYVLSCRECYPQELCPYKMAHFPIKCITSGGRVQFQLPPLERLFGSVEDVIQQLCVGVPDLALKLERPAPPK